MRLISKTIAAVFFVALSFLVLSPLGAGIGDAGVPVALGGAVLIAAIALLAPTGRRAWGRGFVINGLLCIAMPLLVLPLLSLAFTEVTEMAALHATSDLEVAATSIGAGLGTTMMFGAATFLGLVFGAIFTILGLVLTMGGRREVIVVQT